VATQLDTLKVIVSQSIENAKLAVTLKIAEIKTESGLN